jgi:hypothetical protein
LKLLSSPSDPKRNVATDFTCAIRPDSNINQSDDQKRSVTEIYNWLDENIKKKLQSELPFENMQKIAMEHNDAANQFGILRDSIERGTIVASEMQVVDTKTHEGFSHMVDRADDYITFLKEHDHVNGDKDGAFFSRLFLILEKLPGQSLKLFGKWLMLMMKW